MYHLHAISPEEFAYFGEKLAIARQRTFARNVFVFHEFSNFAVTVPRHLAQTPCNETKKRYKGSYERLGHVTDSPIVTRNLVTR